MKKIRKQWRKPLSLVLALCMFMSAASVGLTVFAADLAENRSTSGKTLESPEDLGLKGATSNSEGEEEKTELEIVTEYSQRLLKNYNDTEAENWLWDKLIENLKKGYESGIFKEGADGLSTTGSVGWTNHTSQIQDDAEGTAYNTLMVYFALQRSKMQFKGSDDGSGRNWLGGMLKTYMQNTLKGKMGGDFDTYGVFTTLRWLSAIWNADHNCKNDKAFVVATLAPAGKTYLTRYATLDKVPEHVPTQYGTAVCHKNYGGNMPWNPAKWGFEQTWMFGGSNVDAEKELGSSGGNIADNNKYAKMGPSDKTSKKTLLDFQNVFSSEILNIVDINDINSYKAEQFAGILGSKAILDEINTMDVSVGTHFFAKDIDIYEGTPFARANEIYSAVVELTNSAYDNFQTKVAEIDTAYGAKELVFDDFAPLKAGLDAAIAFYNIIEESKKGDTVIVEAKAKYDQLLEKYNAQKVPVYQSVADEKIAELYNALKQTVTVDGNEFKISEFVKPNSTTVAFDNVPKEGKGFIKTAADLYYTLAKIAIGGQFVTGATPASIMNWVTDRITKNEVYVATDYNNFGMGDVLAGFSQQNTMADFNLITNPLLYTYNNISEIADNVISQKTTYTLSIDENGKITTDEQIIQKTIQVPDRKAKTDFGLWAKSFDESSVAQDLSKMDATALKLSLDKSRSAVEAVKSYDSYVKVHLLGNFGYTFEQGMARIDEIVKAIVDNFVTRATSFNAEYADMTVVVTEADYDKFFKKYDDIVALFNLIENKTPEIEALKAEADRLNGIACMKKYLDDAEKVDAFYKPGTTEIAPFTSRTITTANDLLKAMKKHYAGILPADLTNQLIIDAKAKQDALEKAINDYFGGSTRPWEKTTMSYDGVENASTESLRGIIDNIDGLFGTDILNSILGPALKMDLPEGKPLNEALYDEIVKLVCANGGTIANAIMQMVGPEINKQVASMPGLVFDAIEGAGLGGAWPDRAAKKLEIYPNVAAELYRAKADWGAVDYSKLDWIDKNGKSLVDYANEGKGVEAFVQMIGAVVAPFWGVFRALLNNKTTTVVFVEAVKGYPGMLNQVFPMLMQLGVGKNPNDTNQAWNTVYCREFTLPVGNSWGASTNNPQNLVDIGNGNDTWQVMGKLLIPIFDWLKNEVLTNPVESITKLLPQLSEMMASNRIVEGLNKITAPLGDVLGDLLGSIDLTSVNGLLEMVFPDKKIILPDGSTINLPDLDQGLLAGLAEQKKSVSGVDVSNGYSKAFNGGTDMVQGIVLDTSETYDQVLFYLLKYVIGTVKENEEVISSLFGEKETAITKLLKTALSKDDDTMLNSIIGVLMNKKDIEDAEWDMSQWKFDEGTVDYGDVTNAQAKKALESIDKLINSVVKIALSTDLKSLVGGSIYTDGTMNSIMSLFKMIGTDQIIPILEMLGIDVSVKAVADNLLAYPAVSNYLKETIDVVDEAGAVTGQRLRTWAEVDMTGISWGFEQETASADFATAIAKIFKPFNGILETLLVGKDFPVLGGVVTIKGANGYANSVLPLLNGILGCDALSAEAFSTAVGTDPDMMLASIIKPVLDKVDKILESPVGTLADVLPNLAYFVDNGGLTKILNNLLLPITQVTDELMPLLADADGKAPNLFDVIKTIILDNPTMSPDVVEIINMIDFSDHAFLDNSIAPLLTKVLGNLKINETTTLQIKLPNIEWGKLAGMGKQTADGGFFQRITQNTNHIAADRGAVGVTLMNFLFSTVTLNKDMILSMLSGVDLGTMTGTVTQFLTNVLANEPAALTSALIKALSVENPADDDWDLGDFTDVVTDKLYKSEDEQRAKEAIAKTDILLAGVLTMVVPDAGSIEELVKGFISDATIKALFQPIYTALDDKKLKDILAKLGLKTSPKDLAVALQGIGDVATILAKYETWAEVFADPDWATASFGVDPSNVEETFALAISKMFAPFEGILQALLVKKDFAITGEGGYEIKGANGYNNSILPILGALGATSEDGILTSDEMMAIFVKDTTNPDAENGVLYSIVKPALNAVFRATKNPVTFLANMLPNFALFMEKGALTTSVMNLLKPLTQISDVIVGLDNNKSTLDFVIDLLEELKVTLPEGLDLNNIEGTILDVVNGFLAKGIKVGEKDSGAGDGTMVDIMLNIQLPEFDWKTLAGRGERLKNSDITFMMNADKGSKQYVDADEADVYMAVLNYLALTATSNKDAILALLADLAPTLSPEIIGIVETILSADSLDIATAIMHVINTKEITDDPWDMTDFVQETLAKLYPDDADRISEAITKTDEMINGILSKFVGLENGLSGLLTGNFSDSNAKELFKLVFTTLDTHDITSVMSTLKFDLSPKAMADIFQNAGFTDFATFLNTAIDDGDTTWAAIFAREDWATATFNVTDSDSFAKAISAMFVPFDGVIKALAAKDNDYQLAGIYSVKSANGYKTAVLPLLGALGCTEADEVMSADEFANDLKSNPNQGALLNIIKPILKMAERASANPVDFLTKMLPNFAFFMDNKGLTQSLTNLIKPITNITDELVPLFGLEEGATSIDLVEYLLGIFVPADSPVKDVLAQIDFKDIEGSVMDFAYKFLEDGIKIDETTTISIKLPKIDWHTLAGRGELKTNADAPFFAKVTGDKTYKYVEADQEEVLMAVLTYVAQTVLDNETEITKLLSTLLGDTYKTLEPIIVALLNNDAKTIADAIMHVIATKDIEDFDWSMEKLLHEALTAIYTGDEEQRVKEAISKLDTMIETAIAKFVPSLSSGLPGAITGVMSNENIKVVFDLVYKALGTAETTNLMKTLELDISATAVKTAFENANLGNVAAIIDSAITANADVTMAEIILSEEWKAVDFGVTNSDTFAQALSTMFVPFNDLLKALLIKGDSYMVAGLYEVKSSNGYAEAVLPLLGALGCSEALSAEEFAAADNATYGVLYNIIKPVLKMAETALARPVDFLTKMLPNLAFFMDNKGLTQSLTNLIKPITNITDELVPLFGLEEGATSIDLVEYLLGVFVPADSPVKDILAQIDFKDIEGSIMDFAYKFLENGIKIDETTISIKLPKIDWATLAGRGELKTNADAPFFAKVTGDKTYKYVEADQEEVLMAVLAYVADAVLTNSDQIKDLLKGLLGDETYGKIETVIDAIFKSNSKELADAIMHIIATKPIEDDNWTLEDVIHKVADTIYKDGEADRVKGAIVKLEAMIEVALKKFAKLDGGINGILTSALNGDTVKTLFNTVYGAIGTAELTGTMNTLGIDISATAVKTVFGNANLGNVATIIDSAITANADVTMAEIILSEEWKAVDFGVTDTGKFAQALSTMFVPFDGVLGAILAGENFKVAGIYEIKGAKGYSNAILPILGALGCNADDNVLAAEEFASADRKFGILYNIINPVVNMADRASKSPVDFLTSMLPNFAFFMDSKGLTRSLTNLIKPLTNITDEILPVLKDLPGLPENPTTFDLVKVLLGMFIKDDAVTSIVDGIDFKDLEGSIMNLVYGFLEGGIKINETTTINLKIPKIDWHTLAGRGVLKTDADAPFFAKLTGNKNYKYVEADQADSFMAVLNYIATILTTNKDEVQKLLAPLFGGMEDGAIKDTVNGLISNVLDSKSEDIANAIMHVLNTTEIPDAEWDMTSFIFKLTTGMLGGKVTNEEVLDAIGIVDKTVSLLVPKLTENGNNLKQLLQGSIYTDATVNAVFTGLFGAIGSVDISNVLTTFNIDVSVDGMKKALKAYPAITAIIAKHTSMADVANDPALKTASWNITDKNSLADAIAAVLSPFNSLLKALMIKDSANNFDIMELYKIKSSNGYAESVLPMLAALGCTDLKSASEYKGAVGKNENALVAEIIKPVLSLVEKVADNPVDTLASILPNIAYFINNDGIAKVLENLIKPLSNVLDEIIPIISTPLDNGKYPTSMGYILGLADTFLPKGVEGVMVSEIVNDTKGVIVPVINLVLAKTDIMGQKFQLPAIDFGVLAGCGERVDGADAPFLPKALGNTKLNYIKADKSQSTMAVLNYVVKTLQLNEDALLTIVGGLIKDNEELSTKITNVIKLILDNDPSSISGALIKLITYKGDEDYTWKDMIWEVAKAVYPSGVTGGRVTTTAKGIDKVLKNALDVLLNTDLESLVEENLYTSANLNAIVTALYGAVGTKEIQAITSMFGVDTSVNGFTKAVAKDYPKVATFLSGKTEWAEVDLTNADWAVADANGFSKALATALAPFNNLLKFFLVGGYDLQVLEAVTLHSGKGYENAIVPFLNALGCENVMSGEEYKAAVEKDETVLLTAIINPVLGLLGKIAENPVVTLASILPNFAYFMDNHGVTQMIDALLLPVTGMMEPVIELITKDSLINFVINLIGVELPIDINNIENEIVPLINGIIGTQFGLEIPEFSWHRLAGFGKLSPDGKVVASINDVAVSLMNYIASVPSYKDNGKAIIALLGDSATGIVGDIVRNVVTASPASLVTMIVDLFDPTNEGLDGKWNYKTITSQAPSYTPNLSEEDFAEGIVVFDAMIPGLLSSFAGGATLQDLVGNGVFTNQMVNTIGGAIFGLLGSDDIAGILETVADATGIDLTPGGVAHELVGSRFSNARKAMNSASTWADVDFTKINWGFKDGDQNAFLETVVAMLRPALGVLEVVLNGEDFVLLDGVVIKGADGYNNAIIPLLEALCCDNILTQKQYNAEIQKNQDNVILAILRPVMAKLNDLLVAPMDTLTEVLPNIGYFMYNDGLAQLLDNILLPINKILKSVSPVYEIDLDSVLGTVKNVNVPDALNSLLAGIEVNGAPLGIRVNNFSWENLAACGVPMQFASPQVDGNGKAVNATKIDSNKSQTFVTVLRYLVATIQDPGNLAAINALLDGVDLGSLGSVVTGLLASIGSMDVDGVIEMLFAALLGIGVEEEEEVGGTTTKPTTTPSTTKPSTTVPAKPGTTTPGNVAPTQPAPSEDGNKVNLPLIIGLAIAGLLLLALAIWLIIFLRKKKNAENAALGSTTTAALGGGSAETASTTAESKETVSNKKE